MRGRFRPGRDSGLHGCVRRGHWRRSGRSRIVFPALARGSASFPEPRASGLSKEKQMFIIKDDDNIIFIVDIAIILIDYGGMMCLSQTTGYAVRALVCLNEQGGRACLTRDIAKSAGIPKPYLARIVNDLTHKELVTAKRGCRGGVALARPAAKISLLQVVEAVEGPDWIAPCLLGLNDCAAHILCPSHVAWQRISKQLKALLGRTTVADVTTSPTRKPANPRLTPRRAAA